MMWNLALFVSLLTLAPTQDAPVPRGRLTAKLVDDKGKALVGVPVRLLARAHANVIALQPLDQIEVTSGKNGRFQAQLISGLDYGVFALRPKDPDSYRWTAVMGGIQAGERRVLEFQAKLNGRVRLRVDGREAWKSQEPLRFSVHVTPGQGAPWVLKDFDPEGKRALPMMPGNRLQVRVRGKSGMLLSSAWFEISKTGLAARAKKQAALSEEERAKEDLLFVEPNLLRLRIAAPVKMLLEITAESKKKQGFLQKLMGGKSEQKPVPGARVWIHDMSRRILAATSDEKGLAIVTLPEQWAGAQPVLIEADGYSVAAATLRRDAVEKGRDLDALRKKGTPDVKIELLQGERAQTRILLGAGRPAARMPVLLKSSVSLGKNSSMTYGTPWIFWTDDKGRLDLPGRPSQFSCRLDLVLDLATRQALTPKGKQSPSPLVTLYQGTHLHERLPKEIDLSRLGYLQILVKSPPGSERMAPEVLIGRIHDKKLDEGSVRSVLADPKGRLTLLVPRGGEWALGACSKAGIQLTRLQWSAKTGPEPVEIRLHGALFIEGVVQTSGQDPVPGTRVRCKSGLRTRPELDLLHGVSRYREILEPLCDSKGRFRIAVPEPSQKYTLTFSVPIQNGGRMSQSGWNHEVVVGEDSRSGVEITIDPPGGR